MHVDAHGTSHEQHGPASRCLGPGTVHYRRSQVSDSGHCSPGQRPKVPCIPLLDCEYGIGSVETPAFFFPSSREKLSSLTVLPVKTVAVGEHVQRIDQFEHRPRNEFEQPGVENI